MPTAHPLKTNINKQCRTYRLWILALLLVAIIFVFKPNEINPELSFTTLSGEKHILKHWRGHPVLLTFWATDCPSCVAEIPHLIDLYQRYHCSGLEVVAIAMAYDPPNHVLEMQKSRHIPYPIALDLTGEYALAFGQVSLTPTTFLLGPDGKIVKRQLGLFDVETMQALIKTYTKDNSCSG